jgi:hypothetical protein
MKAFFSNSFTHHYLFRLLDRALKVLLPASGVLLIGIFVVIRLLDSPDLRSHPIFPLIHFLYRGLTSGRLGENLIYAVLLVTCSCLVFQRNWKVIGLFLITIGLILFQLLHSLSRDMLTPL